MKISSIARPKVSAIRNARGKDGSYLPVSIALMLWRETPMLSASLAWDQPRSDRSFFRRLFTTSALYI